MNEASTDPTGAYPDQPEREQALNGEQVKEPSSEMLPLNINVDADAVGNPKATVSPSFHTHRRMVETYTTSQRRTLRMKAAR